MNDLNILDIPEIHSEIENKSKEIGFTMPSDLYIGSLLKTLITSKPKSNILELGTGIGLSLSWMIDGMYSQSKLISIDNDPKLIEIAKNYFGKDKRVEIICADGTEWIKSYKGEKFDLVFAMTKDLYLFLGTSQVHHHVSHNPFMIIGTFHPNVENQTKLF